MSETEELTDEQRLSILEGKVGKNRTVIIVISIAVVVILSVSLTLTLLNALGGDKNYATQAAFEEQKVIIASLSAELEKQRSQLGTLSLNYKQSEVFVFQQTMIEQEQSYQEFLKTLKLGMYDLAKMIQGARTWLDVYNDKVDDGLNASKQREKNLKRIK